MELIKRAYRLISSHPVILVPQIGTLALNIIYGILIMDRVNNLMIGIEDPLSAVASLGGSMVLQLIIPLVIGLGGLIIYSGSANMIKAAINEKKTSIGDFGQGIKKYLGKIILSTLLAAAVAILAVLVISIIGVLLLFLSLGGMNFGGGGQMYEFGALSTGGIIAVVVFTLSIIILIIVVSVLISLWLPAIVMDDEGVIKGFSKGFKAAKKNFWTILGMGALYAIIIAAVAIGLNLLYSTVNRTALLDTPPFHYMDIISYVVTIILTTIFNAFLLLIYKKSRDEEDNQGGSGDDKTGQGTKRDNEPNMDGQNTPPNEESGDGLTKEPDGSGQDTHIPMI